MSESAALARRRFLDGEVKRKKSSVDERNKVTRKGPIANLCPNRRLSPQGHFRFYGRAKLSLKTRSARRRFLDGEVKRPQNPRRNNPHEPPPGPTKIYPNQVLAIKFVICIMHRTVLRKFTYGVVKHQSAE